MKRGLLGGVCIVSLLTLTPGCDWFSKREKQGSTSSATAHVKQASPDHVLLSIDDRPVITTDSFEEDMEQLVNAANPQMKAMIQFMPNIKEEIFGSMANSEVLLEWVRRNNITNDAQYKKDRAQALKMLDLSMAEQAFKRQHGVSVSDSEVRKFYEENKNTIPQLCVSQGGVATVGVSFDSEGDAREFYNKINQPGVPFEKTAEDQKLEVRDFNLVSESTQGINETVKKQVLAVKKFPSAHLIKISDKEFWVVETQSKQDAQHVPYDQIKTDLKQYLEQQKVEEKYKQDIERLKKEYKVKAHNPEYFKPKAPEHEQGAKDGTPLKPQSA